MQLKLKFKRYFYVKKNNVAKKRPLIQMNKKTSLSLKEKEGDEKGRTIENVTLKGLIFAIKQLMDPN